ncbi:MAG: hypothetical protein EOP51_06130 [Sphingobacteriales bacterium]|nr:MAG: hypothetical protein EOP51_06130 [Sphingobacteriales bacterium]
MDFNEYFQSYSNYFWQWEDDGDVIAIPNGSTIAYKEYILDIFTKLSPQGMPPFGSLLLAIIATNPNGKDAINTIFAIVDKATAGSDNFTTITQAVEFLALLSEVPEQYKQGKKRILLLLALFERCHNIVAGKNLRDVTVGYHSHTAESEIFIKKTPTEAVIRRDFRTISLLKNKFNTVEDILNRMAPLPDLNEEIELVEDDGNDPVPSQNFIDQLIGNTKTFHVGSLIKHIWSGLNIPVHSSLPSQQALGGVSDLTNKGDFDKLLISEFANDDIVFLSRLANNEALYIHRETPPATNKLQRIILIDISLKNWGTPKAIAFAAMLAIATHPKTNIDCKVYVVGNLYQPVSFHNIHSLIESLQILEGCLHPAQGLASFFKEEPIPKDREIIFISEASTYKNAEMLKFMNEHQALFNYWIQTDAQGNIDILKRHQSSKKHIQHMQLPLQQLWQEQAKKEVEHKLLKSGYPLLFRNPINSIKLLSTADDVIYILSRGAIFQRPVFKNISSSKNGWLLLHEDLPYTYHRVEIGLLDNGQHMLLMFNAQNKGILLQNLTTGDKKVFTFNKWSSTSYTNFIFYQNSFYLLGNVPVKILPDGTVEDNVKESKVLYDVYKDRLEELSGLTVHVSSRHSILKNVNELYINQRSNLVFNVHELNLNSAGHIKLQATKFNHRVKQANRVDNDRFLFDDGSYVQINANGMFTLVSANNNIETVYIPAVLNESIGIATQSSFAGNRYYFNGYRGEQFKHMDVPEEDPAIPVVDCTVFFDKQIVPFIKHIIDDGTVH